MRISAFHPFYKHENLSFSHPNNNPPPLKSSYYGGMGKKEGTAIGFGIYALELVSTPPGPLRVNIPQPLFNGSTVGDIDCWGGSRACFEGERGLLP